MHTAAPSGRRGFAGDALGVGVRNVCFASGLIDEEGSFLEEDDGLFFAEQLHLSSTAEVDDTRAPSTDDPKERRAIVAALRHKLSQFAEDDGSLALSAGGFHPELLATHSFEIRDDADEDCDFARNVHVFVTDFIVINVFIRGFVSHFGPSDRSHFERLPFTNG